MATATTSVPTSATERRHRRLVLLVIGLMLAQIMAAIEGSIVINAMLYIVSDLGGISLAPWVFVSYGLASTASTLLWGKLSDLLGRRGLYFSSILIFMVGAVTCGMAPTMSVLVLGRTIQGVGAGGLFTLSMTILADVISPRERGRYQGYMGAMFAVATMLGPWIGGLIVDNTSWRWVFFMNLPLGAIGMAIGIVTLRNIPFHRREHVLDIVGAALLVVWVSALVLMTNRGSSWGWTSFRVVTLGVVGIGGLASFVMWERQAPEPVLPLHLFRMRVFTTTSVLAFLHGMAMFAATVLLPPFLQVALGVSASSSGLLLAPVSLGMLAGSIGSGQVISRTGRYRVFPVVGAVIATAGFAALAQLDTGSELWVAVAFGTMVGFGIGLGFQTAMLAVQNVVDHEHLGIATSAGQFFRNLGGTFGSALVLTVYLDRLDFWLRDLGGDLGLSADSLRDNPAQIREFAPDVRAAVEEAFARSITTAFAVVVPFVLVSIVAAWLIPEHPLRARALVGDDRDQATIPADLSSEISPALNP